MIEYEEDWIVPLVFRLKGSVIVRASLFAIPASLLAILLVYIEEEFPTWREEMGITELKTSQAWTLATAALSLLLSFRTSQAMSRFWEGTGLLHQMRGEWFDAVSCCVTFTRAATGEKKDEVMRFRHTLVRLMSLCHGSALEEIKGADESDTIEVIDVAGLDIKTLKILHECKEVYQFNRVELLLHMSQTIITKALEDQVITVAPPICSRVYQTLSRGFVNLLNAKKICDTRFPFPYAQLIAMLVLANVLLTPLIVSAFFQTKFWSFLFTFVPVFGMASLSFIASELENPFGNDDNDLPLMHFQSEMNNCLLLLLHNHADHIPTTGPSCIMDFDVLMSAGDGEEEDLIGGPRPENRRGSAHEAAILAAGKWVSETSSGVEVGRNSSRRKSLTSVISEEEEKLSVGTSTPAHIRIDNLERVSKDGSYGRMSDIEVPITGPSTHSVTTTAKEKRAVQLFGFSGSFNSVSSSPSHNPPSNSGGSAQDAPMKSPSNRSPTGKESKLVRGRSVMNDGLRAMIQEAEAQENRELTREKSNASRSPEGGRSRSRERPRDPSEAGDVPSEARLTNAMSFNTSWKQASRRERPARPMSPRGGLSPRSTGPRDRDYTSGFSSYSPPPLSPRNGGTVTNIAVVGEDAMLSSTRLVSSEQLHKIMESWAAGIQRQVKEMARSADAVQHLSRILPDLVDSAIASTVERLAQQQQKLLFNTYTDDRIRPADTNRKRVDDLESTAV